MITRSDVFPFALVPALFSVKELQRFPFYRRLFVGPGGRLSGSPHQTIALTLWSRGTHIEPSRFMFRASMAIGDLPDGGVIVAGRQGMCHGGCFTSALFVATTWRVGLRTLEIGAM